MNWIVRVVGRAGWRALFVCFATAAIADGEYRPVGQTGWFEECCAHPNMLGTGVGLAVSRYQPPAFSLPSFGPGHVFHSDAPRARFELSQVAAWTWPSHETSPVVWQAAISQSTSVAKSSSEMHLASDRPVLLSYGTPPTGSLALTTSVDATGVTAGALVSLVDSTGDTASIASFAFSPPTGAITQSAISVTTSGGALVALLTDGSSLAAAAHGAIYDDGGIAFFAVGDMGATSFTTSSRDKTTGMRIDLSAAWPIASSSAWAVTARAGPVLSSTDRNVTRSEMITITPTVSNGTPIGIGISALDALSTRGYGATGGLTLSRPLNDDWALSLGTSLSYERYVARYRGRTSIEGAQTGHIGLSQTRARRTGTTGRARLQADLSRAIGNGGVLSFSVYGERGMGIPTLSVSRAVAGRPVPVTTGDTTTLTTTGTPYRRTIVTTASSWEIGASVAIVYRF